MPQPPQPPKQPREQPTLPLEPAPALATGADAATGARAHQVAARTRAQLAPSSNKDNKQAQCPHYRAMPQPGKIPQPPENPVDASGALGAGGRRMRAGPGPGQMPGAARDQLQHRREQRSKQAQCPPYRQRKDTLGTGK